jgi:acyl carrier protein
MDQIRARLVNCFQTVFPDLPEADIPFAGQASLATWDSVSMIALVNVLEEEFTIVIDLESVADLDSFDRIHEYVVKQVSA